MLKKTTVLGFLTIVFSLAAYAAIAADDENRTPPKQQSSDRDPPPRPLDQEGEKAAPRRSNEGEPAGLPPGQAPGEDRQRSKRGQGFGGNSFHGEGRPNPAGSGGPWRGAYPDWAALEKRDPDLCKLMRQELDLWHQTRDLSKDYRQASTEKRDEIKKQIEKLVDDHFEARQQRRQLELKRLEAELKRLRETIDHRNQDRKKIVEKRVSELLSREEEAGF